MTFPRSHRMAEWAQSAPFLLRVAQKAPGFGPHFTGFPVFQSKTSGKFKICHGVFCAYAAIQMGAKHAHPLTSFLPISDDQNLPLMTGKKVNISKWLVKSKGPRVGKGGVASAWHGRCINTRQQFWM